MMKAWTVYTNANLAKPTFLWYDNLGDIGMARLPFQK